MARGVSIKFDQGHGKIKMLLAVSAKRYQMCTIANSAGVQHPFISWSVADEYIKCLTN